MLNKVSKILLNSNDNKLRSKTNINTTILNIVSMSTTLYAVLIVALVFIIAMLIGILYIHNNDNIGTELPSAHGALPQKPPFGEGMAYSTAISIQIHGEDIELKGLVVPKIFDPEIPGKKGGGTTT